jgi:hypothetical protein
LPLQLTQALKPRLAALRKVERGGCELRRALVVAVGLVDVAELEGGVAEHVPRSRVERLWYVAGVNGAAQSERRESACVESERESIA